MKTKPKTIKEVKYDKRESRIEDGIEDGAEDGNEDGIEDGAEEDRESDEESEDGIEDGAEENRESGEESEDGIEDGNEDGIEEDRESGEESEDGIEDGIEDGAEDRKEEKVVCIKEGGKEWTDDTDRFPEQVGKQAKRRFRRETGKKEKIEKRKKLEETKMTKTKKMLCTVAGLGIAAAIAVGAWLGYAALQGGSDTKAPGTSFLITSGEENGIKLTSETIAVEDYATYGISEQADSAQLITATVNSDATDQSVDFSCDWSDDHSEWASGKTVSDYVTLTQATDGALTATVTCLEAFGEPIVITVSSRSNPEITATANCNYVKKISSVTLNLIEYDADSKGGRVDCIQILPNFTYQASSVYALGVGTITPTVAVTYQLSATTSFLGQAGMTQYYLGAYSKSDGAFAVNDLFGKIFTDSAASRYQLYTAGQNASGNSFADAFSIKATFTVSYNGTEYDSTEGEILCSCYTGKMDCPVISITLGPDILF